MGSSQSSHAAYGNKTRSSSELKSTGRTSSVRGRKRSNLVKEISLGSAPFGLVGSYVSHHSDDEHHPDLDFSDRISYYIDEPIFENLDVATDGVVHSDDCSVEDTVSISSDESEEEEVDEELEEERLRILEDARNLKETAGYFLHPENPVPNSFGARCFFDRMSAPPQLSIEEAEEVGIILDEATALKKLATDYLHPERSLESLDPSASGRNYFTRSSAPDQEINEFTKQKEQVLRDAKSLKIFAKDFMHPELPVTVDDCTLFGRNFFTRFSAPVVYDQDLSEERNRILDDARALRRLAVDYLHPEIPVTTSDPTLFGRNYLSRSTHAREQESLSDETYRKQVMEDLKAFKETAVYFLHPEVPVAVRDPCFFGRNFFNRYSSHEQESLTETRVRKEVMEDMAAMKKLARDFLHPEVPFVADATAFGRNYFMRPSEENDFDTEERNLVLQDAKQLKKLARDYLHPELPVAVDAAVFGRNYFSRLSAPAEDDEIEEYRDQLLQDVKHLKKLARDYLHPGLAVEVDATMFGRNYFMRPSALVFEDEVEERDLILQDAMALKKLAQEYLHPERPVVLDAPVFGRNYFTRPSAPSIEDPEERELILQDALYLKEVATCYLHPELPAAFDAALFGRNFFTRPSAPPQVDEDDTEERELALQDAMALKKLARDYLHPEVPAVVDPKSFGRNYFTRPFAPTPDIEYNKRELVLQDTFVLKKLARDFLHPELPVEVDAVLFGRNYFTRLSAYEDNNDYKERELVLQDALALKKLARDYLHPELPVEVDAAVFGRNYFTRPSANANYSNQSFDDGERELVLQDAMALKKLARDYLHPELPVVVDGAVFGRNYFTRPSAPIEDEEHELVLQDVLALKKLAQDYLHPELPVAVDAVSFGRNYFTRPSSAAYVKLDDIEEYNRIMEDIELLKKAAIDYRHPELPVITTDSLAFGRNYFDRPSAYAHYYMIHTYPAHEDEYEESHHHEHLDHFGMDDEMAMYEDIRHELSAQLYEHDPIKNGNEEGGNLSRSPSSVMLFELAS